jgi:hypothetical protein
MKLIALTLALTATISAFAQPAPTPLPAEPAAKAPISAEVKEQLNAALPKYVPAPEVKKPDPFAATTTIREQSFNRASEAEKAEGDEVLELPKVTVKQQPKPRPRLGLAGDHTILGPKAFNEDLAKKNLSALDRSVLNKWTLPSWLGGQSAADRAREDYNIDQKRKFLDDVLTISKAVEQTDPAAAKALKEAAAKP